MEPIVKKKIEICILSSVILFVAFLTGLLIPTMDLAIGLILGFVIVPLLLISNYFLQGFFEKDFENSDFKKKISIWVMLTFNLLFVFVIGITIPLMETKIEIRYNMAYVMIPLLTILNCIFIDRFHYYLRHLNKQQNNIKDEIKNKKKDVPVIEFEGKKYIFSIRSIAILAIGAPILSYVLYLFFDNEANYWIHEIVVKQTLFVLNFLFNMNATAVYRGHGKYHWSFIIPGRGRIFFETFCTGIQAIAVFAGIIICTPHSKHKKTNEDIIWRKTKSLVLSSIIFYVVNIVRMVIQIYLFSIGYAWADIHYSISAASSFIAAIIILLMHKWIPEFIISIIYTGTLISKKLKGNKEIDTEDKNTTD